jgi:2-desacetyl-2-hydroxyethyl bacteriochlorophyllide A dehydrogenase
MAQRFVFTGKQQVQLESFAPPALGDSDVRVQTLYTLVSTGTEMIVLDRLFDPGTHWDNWVKYPFYPGYSNVGRVAAVGPRVTRPKVGDTVVSRFGHTSQYVCPAEAGLWVLPAGIDPRAATWFALAKIASMGARVAQYQLGDTVLVIGAGPVGQMTIRWAAAAGVARLIVIDRFEQRLALAKAGGATAAIAKAVDQAADEVKAANDGQLPRVVVDTTGHPQVFPCALRLAARLGRVVLLGDTGTPAQQHLTGDVVTQGLTIVGAHDCHEDAAWNSPKVFDLFCSLVKAGRFPLDGLNSHTFQPHQCKQAYDTARTQREKTMGLLLDWTQLPNE